MCDYCNPKMYDREVYYDATSDTWFLDIETGEWSDYNDDFVHIHRQINYCPYCGRRLRCKNEKNEVQIVQQQIEIKCLTIQTYEETVAYENPC